MEYEVSLTPYEIYGLMILLMLDNERFSSAENPDPFEEIPKKEDLLKKLNYVFEKHSNNTGGFRRFPNGEVWPVWLTKPECVELGIPVNSNNESTQ